MARVKGIRQTIEELLKEYFAQHNDITKIHNLYSSVLTEVERILITKTLKETHNNQSQAAKILGINRNTLINKMKKFSL